MSLAAAARPAVGPRSAAVGASGAARLLAPLRLRASQSAEFGVGALRLANTLLQRSLALAVAEVADAPSAAAAAAQQGEGPEEKVSYSIVNFFHLVDIEKPYQASLGGQRMGRVGINAQYGGRTEDTLAYAEWLRDTQPLFKGLRFAVFPVDGHMYPRLRLKYRPSLISLAGGMQGLPITDPAARATPVPPAEWKRMLSEAQELPPEQRPIVLDVRNDYEWDAGHFEGAERPVEAGFKNMYTLELGIQNYLRTEGLDHWKGSLFVFDGRMAVRPNKDTEEPLEAAAPCQVCGGTAVLPHMNCANIDCNKLFIACEACRTKHNGCCCSECQEAPRLLRPAKVAGLYGTWREYADGEEDISAGRGPGRRTRRQRRLAALREREQSKRAALVERRHRAKEAMAAAEAAREGAQGEGQAELDAAAAERAARLERLRELRARMAASA
eukprot:scaffold6.g2807.t1